MMMMMPPQTQGFTKEKKIKTLVPVKKRLVFCPSDASLMPMK